MHNKELHKLYYSRNTIISDKVKDNEAGRICSTHGSECEFI
jgi:hypothetical protein